MKAVWVLVSANSFNCLCHLYGQNNKLRLLTYAGLNVDPLPGEKVLEVLYSKLHELLSECWSLVEDSTSRTSPSLGWKTGGAEEVGAVCAGSLPADEAEGLATEITVCCWGLWLT